MNLPALPLADGNTFFIDNSRFESITKCHRHGEYVVARQRVSADEKSALILGSAAHLALKYRYAKFNGNEMDEESMTRQAMLIDKFYEKHEIPVTEYRTAGFCQALMDAYNKQWVREEFTFIPFGGQNLVEEPFTIPLGKVGDINIVWTGRVDGGIQFLDGQDNVYVLDHKTTSMGGEAYFSEYYTSSQMKGYVFSLQNILKRKIKGVYINALFARKQTKTGKGFEFQRKRIDFSQELLDDWRLNTLQIISDFIHDYKRGYFPMYTTQCITKFGRCQFHDVCTMDPSSRMENLYSSQYKDDIWNPLHDDDIDIKQVDRWEIPKNYSRQSAISSKADAMSQDLNKLLSEI